MLDGPAVELERAAADEHSAGTGRGRDGDQPTLETLRNRDHTVGETLRNRAADHLSDSSGHQSPTPRAPLIAVDTGPARDWAETDRALVVARPDELPDGDTHLSVTRTFCFADLSGFTAYTRAHGPHEAAAILGEFRRVTRNVSVKRGVRVAKWLGDGTMLVSTDAGAAIALGAHLIHHFSDQGVQMRVGAATGDALLFEGDDYIGEAVNLAAKLCAVAPAGEMYAVVDELELPGWVSCLGDVTVHIDGVGRVGGVHRLQPVIGGRS